MSDIPPAADETPARPTGKVACDPLGCTFPGCHRDPDVCRYAPDPTPAGQAGTNQDADVYLTAARAYVGESTKHEQDPELDEAPALLVRDPGFRAAVDAARKHLLEDNAHLEWVLSGIGRHFTAAQVENNQLRAQLADLTARHETTQAALDEAKAKLASPHMLDLAIQARDVSFDALDEEDDRG